MKLAAIALAAGCSGTVGTLSVSLTTAPGSTLLDAVQQLRLTVTNPRQVTTANRTSGGFTIALDLPATGDPSALLVDGLDGAGQLVASGASPAFPVGAINAKLVIDMAAPNSIGAAPVALTPARAGLAAGALTFGAVFAGGTDGAGAASDAIAIYNVYDHTLVGGVALPAPRSGLALGVGAGTSVYLFGGLDAAGSPTGTAWRFDTSVAPAGAYLDYGDKVGFARAGEIAVPIGGEKFLISGAPVAELSGLDGSMVARGELAMLPATGATVVAADGVATTIFVGSAGVTRFRNGVFDSPNAPGRTGGNIVALPSGKVGLVCGTADALRLDAATGAAETFPNLPSAIASGCAVAATARYLVVATGATAEIYDAGTLALIATAPLVVPRTGAAAIALANGQILIAGGVDATGAPIATLELFTPGN